MISRVSVQNIISAILFTISSTKRIILTGVLSIGVFSIFVYVMFPSYSVQMVGAGFGYAIIAYVDLIGLMIESGGYYSVGLAIVYSFLTAVLFHILYTRLRTTHTTLRQAAVALPGTLTAGCASCGTGLIGLVAGGGVLTIGPFTGTVLQVASIVLVIGVLAIEGDPTVCDVES